MNYSKEKWIAVTVAIVVIGLFFGGMFAYRTQQSNSELTNLDQKTMDDNNQDDSMMANVSGSMMDHESSANPGQSRTTADGLIIQDEVVGTGKEAKAGSSVTVNYVGTLQDGTKFDSSFDHGQPFTFDLGVGKVIQGWDEGVAGMKVGGKRKLVIPPTLGYGSQGAGGVIPPNATLVFEVELVSVQ